MNNDNIEALPKVLIYQSENCDFLIDYLKYYNFKVVESTDEDIYDKIRGKSYDLVVADHIKNQSPTSELDLLKLVRRVDKNMPVIMLSDKSNYPDIIKAFDEGADDYVVRPYNVEEFIRRIKAVFRRCGIGVRRPDAKYILGNYTFDVINKTLTLDGVETKLNPKLSQILALLCAYKNELMPKKILAQRIWTRDDYNHLNGRCIDVYICNLRNYLKADKRVSIDTIQGLGYSLIVKED